MQITNKKLLILAGGFGTRLAKVVNDVPKPLAPVNNKPFLYYIIESYRAQGIHDFVFLIHHMADKMKAFVAEEVQNGILKGAKTALVEEHTPMGTGGAVSNAVHELKLEENFLVTNADTWLNNGVQQLLSAEAPVIASIHVEDVSRYGALQISNNKIVSFLEKSPDRLSGNINAGLYYLKPSYFYEFGNRAFSMETDLFPLLAKDHELNVQTIQSEFIDIGIPEDYFRFCQWIESNKENKL